MLGFLTTHAAMGARFAERIGLDPAVGVGHRPGLRAVGRQGRPRPAVRGTDRAAGAAGAAGQSGRGVQPAPRHPTRRWRWSAGTRAPSSTRPSADLFCASAAEVLDGVDEAADWDAVLDVEPEPCRRVSGAELDVVLEAMADLADLKSPYFAGHSRGVANLAAEAARALGLPADDQHRPAAGRVDSRPRPGRCFHRDLGQAEPAHRHRAGTGPASSAAHRPHAGPGQRAERATHDRRSSPRAAGRLRVPEGAHRVRADSVRIDCWPLPTFTTR